MYLDSTISFLRTGLALLNPARLKATNLWTFFKGWRFLGCSELVDTGFHPPFEHASTWIGMNLMMIAVGPASIEHSQFPLLPMLKTQGLTVIPVAMRHARTQTGAVHCGTLDLEQD